MKQAIAAVALLLLGFSIFIAILLWLHTYYFVETLPFPGSVLGLRPRPGGDVLPMGRSMCLLMFEDYFWQSGDFWNTPPDVEISIDHRPVANIAPRIEFYGGVGFPKNEYDDQGSLIGVHGNNFQYCFQPRLDYGEHVLKVEVLPPNRDSLVYYVLFRVE